MVGVSHKGKDHWDVDEAQRLAITNAVIEPGDDQEIPVTAYVTADCLERDLGSGPKPEDWIETADVNSGKIISHLQVMWLQNPKETKFVIQGFPGEPISAQAG